MFKWTYKAYIRQGVFRQMQNYTFMATDYFHTDYNLINVSKYTIFSYKHAFFNVLNIFEVYN